MKMVPLSEVKRHDCLSLLRAAMADVGAAAQTLAAVRRLANNSGETFASVRVIADLACLPERTVKRHLAILVEWKYLEYRRRQRRRTPTYAVPKGVMNAKGEFKYALLPRWAAKMLDSWAERAVFACIVSRDSLNEYIGGDGDCDQFGRLQYSIKALAADSGLSPRAVQDAKQKLVAIGIVKIDESMWWQDDLGRCRTVADTLYLDGESLVLEALVDRPANVARNRTAEMAHCNGSDAPSESLHRVANVAPTYSKNGTCPTAKMAHTPSKNGTRSYGELLKDSSKGITNRTAEPRQTAASAGVLAPGTEEEVGDSKPDRLAEFIANIRRQLPAPSALEDAIQLAFHNGCNLDDLRARVVWFANHQHHWSADHRPGVLYHGLADAYPMMAPDKGWPYQKRA